MLTQEREYTAAEFWEYAQLPENDGRRLELDNGEIVDMGASKQINTVVAGRLVYFLNDHVIPNDLGYVTVPDGGFQLAPDIVRQPDVAFISKARHPRLSGNLFPNAPDIAAEVVSPNEDVFKKVNEYLRAGVQIVWAIYPDEQRVYIFRKTAEDELHTQILDIDDTLDGGAVLPGFRLPLRELFPPGAIS